MIKKVKNLAHGIDEYLMRSPNELLLYRKAIKMKRNLLRIHRLRAAALEGGGEVAPSPYVRAPAPDEADAAGAALEAEEDGAAEADGAASGLEPAR